LLRLPKRPRSPWLSRAAVAGALQHDFMTLDGLEKTVERTSENVKMIRCAADFVLLRDKIYDGVKSRALCPIMGQNLRKRRKNEKGNRFHGMRNAPENCAENPELQKIAIRCKM
jgi:hypothetical protein